MRVEVRGPSGCAAALRGNLAKAGFHVTDSFPAYIIHIERTDSSAIIVDGVDSELERHIVNCISELSPIPIMLQRAGGVQSDRECHISVPIDAELAVEVGVMRGMLKTVNPREADKVIPAPLPRHKKWYQRWQFWARIGGILLLILLSLLLGRATRAQGTSGGGPSQVLNLPVLGSNPKRIVTTDLTTFPTPGNCAKWGANGKLDDQGAACGLGGGGITTLGGQTGAVQTFSRVNDANVTLTITSSVNNHDFTLGWSGALSKARQHAATAYVDQSNAYSTGVQDFEAATVTRPFRRLAFASFPGSCTTNREFLERSDPATAGQVIYVCNAAGNGWDLVGDGGSGGVPNPSANGIVACTGTNCSTSAARTITGTSNKISVTNGDGVSGNPTLNVGSDIVQITDTVTRDFPLDCTNPRVKSTAGNAYFDVEGLATADVDIMVAKFTNNVDGRITCTGFAPNELAASPAAQIIFDVAPHVACGSSQNFRFNVRSRANGSSGNYDTALTAETEQSIAGATTAHVVTRATFTLTNQPAAGDYFIAEIQNNGASGSDTCEQIKEIPVGSVKLRVVVKVKN